MRRQVKTLDGVLWTIRRKSPVVRRPSNDDVTVNDGEGGFLALILSASVVILIALTPILVRSSLFWLVLAGLPLVVLTWLLHWAWWPVALERNDELQYQTSVQGRLRANRLIDEFAAEISRSEDEKIRN